MDSPAIQAEGLTVRYGDVMALRDLTVQTSQGRLCGLVGMNGSGKSSFLKALAGVIAPTQGSIRILGLSPGEANRRGIMGYLPQSEEVDWDFPISVGDLVMMGRYGRLGPTRRPTPADRAAVEAAIGRVGLTGLENRRVGALSGGQRKRAFLARALAQEADLLLLDEPFAGVDHISQAMIVEVLQGFRHEGRTVLIASHDLEVLPRLCDEAILLRNGLVAHAPAEEVFRPEVLALTFGLSPSSGGPGREKQGQR